MRTRLHRGLLRYLLLGLALAGTRAFGEGGVTELRVFRSHDALRADVRAQGLLDKRTTLTIESGLPGTCLYLLRLEDRSGRMMAERYVERSLRFDLWENRYLLEGADGPLALRSLAAADSAISTLTGREVCPLSRLRATDEYQLILQIAVRPLAPEDRERLSHYVSRNSAGGREEVALDLSALFGRPMDEAGGSRQVIRRASPFFRLSDLTEEP